tara:strand:- start:26 stop:424 length:399 start_codon:yes stop_codon:yes gene_type:complete
MSSKIDLNDIDIDYWTFDLGGYTDNLYKEIIIFDISHVTIPIEEKFDTSFIENEEHQFSVYDLDGSHAFLGGWSEMNMSYDDIAECMNEEVFSNKKEELSEEDNEIIIDEILSDYGTDTNTCLLKGKIQIEL